LDAHDLLGDCSQEKKSVQIDEVSAGLSFSLIPWELWSLTCTPELPCLKASLVFHSLPALHSSDINQGLTWGGLVCLLGKGGFCKAKGCFTEKDSNRENKCTKL